VAPEMMLLVGEVPVAYRKGPGVELKTFVVPVV
jgi:hypothetical protein